MILRRNFLKILLISFLLIIIKPGEVFCQTNAVYARVSTDNKIMRVGDEIRITFSLINSTNKDYTFSLYHFNDYLVYMGVYNSQNKHFDGYAGPYWDLLSHSLHSFMLEDFFVLKASKQKDFIFKYKLKRRLIISNYKLRFKYILIDKKKDTIILDDAKGFFIKLEYQPTLGEISAGKRYGFKNMFQGKLISNTVKVRVVR